MHDGMISFTDGSGVQALVAVTVSTLDGLIFLTRDCMSQGLVRKLQPV